ncbi:MAG: ABC transporter permease [Bryobacterales bacterium]|nr:ABC transporter permease [Bryobacterales bacterium]
MRFAIPLEFPSLRVIWRSPGYAGAVVGTLALGMGACGAVFGIYSALMLRELPVERAEELVSLAGIYRNGGRVPASYPMFRMMRERAGSFSSLMGWTGGQRARVEGPGGWEQVRMRGVSGSYFGGLGVTPELGRLIGPEDEEGRARVAVLSYEYWQRRFAGDASVVGRRLRVEGETFTVVGVTRRWFCGLTPGELVELTVPLTSVGMSGQARLENRSLLWVQVAGRLRAGVVLEQARAQVLSTWPELLAANVPTESTGARRQAFLTMGLEMTAASSGAPRGLGAQWREPLLVLLGLLGMILLLAYGNVAMLALARGASRTSEMGVRAALGASWWRMARSILRENLILYALGGLGALGVAYWGGQLLVRGLAERTEVLLNLRPDWRVLAATAGAALVAGLVVSVAPAWTISQASLRGEGRSGQMGLGRWGRALIVLQVAMSVVLLMGSGLLVREFVVLARMEPGFARDAVGQVGLAPRMQGTFAEAEQGAYTRTLLERVEGLPEVEAAAYSSEPVPAGRDAGWLDTVALRNGQGEALATLVAVSPGFFRTLRMGMARGRDFEWNDVAGGVAVALADENLARRLGGEVVGKRVRFGVQPEFQELELVGVARSARVIDPRDGRMPVIYVPVLQHPRWGESGQVLVRGRQPGFLAQAAARAVESLGRETAISVQTLEEVGERALGEERALAALAGFVGAMALALAGTGLFGLISYATQRRRREIGIRMALGAAGGRVGGMVLGQTLRLTGVGILVGLPCGLGASRMLASRLYGVSPHDPVTIAMVCAALALVGATAAYVPARRAMAVAPAEVLRGDLIGN